MNNNVLMNKEILFLRTIKKYLKIYITLNLKRFRSLSKKNTY